MCRMILPGLLTLLVVGLESCQNKARFPDRESALLQGMQDVLLTPADRLPLACAYTGVSSARRQLDITSTEAAACRLVANEGVKVIAHPRTCSAFIFCNYEYLNNLPFFRRKVVLAEPESCPYGTFWVDGRCQAESSTAACSKNPCAEGNRGLRFTDGYACNSYVTCVQTAEGLELKHQLCPTIQRFDVDSGNCVNDVTCNNTNLYKEQIVSCKHASGPLETVGVSYYNKTVRDANNPLSPEVVLSVQCPSGQVFDDKNCSCANKPVKCPYPLISLRSQAGSDNKTWSSYRWVLEPIDTLSLSSNGWAQFDGSNSLISAALADNELAAGWELSFTVQVMTMNNGQLQETNTPNLSPGQTMALVGNSQNSPNCQSATLEVYLDSQSRIIARARNVAGVEQSLTSNPIPSLRQPITVSLSRNDQGVLTLSVVSTQTDTKTAQLGTARLAATKCGLIMGMANNRNNLIGRMDNVSLTRQCTAEELGRSA